MLLLKPILYLFQERLWTDHHTPHHHIHHKGPLVCPSSSDSEYCKESESPASSDSEDLHYGPGIVNRLRNKYLSLALRESNPRPTILRKATSLENLLDDDGGRHAEKDDGFIRRTSANNEGGMLQTWILTHILIEQVIVNCYVSKCSLVLEIFYFQGTDIDPRVAVKR